MAYTAPSTKSAYTTLTSTEWNVVVNDIIDLNTRIRTVTSSTRPSSPSAGNIIYETDTNATLVYNGTSWVSTFDNDYWSFNNNIFQGQDSGATPPIFWLTANGAATNGQIVFQKSISGGATTDGTTVGQLVFQGHNGTANATIARIVAVPNGTTSLTNNSGKFYFYTPSSGTTTQLIGLTVYTNEIIPGADALTTPTQTTVRGTNGSGTNIDGGDLQIIGGKSTGSGNGGQILLATTAPGAAGLTVNTPTNRITIDKNGFVSLPASSFGRGAPVTKTSSFTLATSENWIICNGTASITVTLPTASSWTGREVTIKNIAAFTVVSASSNVVPIGSTTAGTAILAATAGKFVTLVSDGTNWVTMAAN